MAPTPNWHSAFVTLARRLLRWWAALRCRPNNMTGRKKHHECSVVCREQALCLYRGEASMPRQRCTNENCFQQVRTNRLQRFPACPESSPPSCPGSPSPDFVDPFCPLWKPSIDAFNGRPSLHEGGPGKCCASVLGKRRHEILIRPTVKALRLDEVRSNAARSVNTSASVTFCTYLVDDNANDNTHQR